MRGVWLVGLSSFVACRAPMPEAEPQRTDGVALVVEPPAENGSIRSVSRFHLETPAALAGDVLVVRGELSDYHLGKIRDGELPKTLVERLLPTRSWGEPGGVVVSPLVALEPSEVYSIASAELGLVAALPVAGDAAPPLSRVWPPLGQGAAADFWLFCGQQAAAPFEEVFLEPGHWSVGAMPEQSGCLRLSAYAPVASEEALVPPVSALGHPLEPAALAVAAGGPVPALACAAPEQPFGPGCIAVLDDRAVLRAPAVPTLWSVSGQSFSMLEALGPGSRRVLRGLVPASTQSVAFWVRDPFAEVARGEQLLVTGPAAAHLVLNEVFANPLGAEPAQEWVELTNDGTSAVELSAFSLRDAGGEVVLPPHLLEPGAFVLLVREDFVATAGPDPAPAAGAKLLRLPSLGKNGLSNSGEALELVGAGGQRVSAFPALPKPKPGVSVARKHPWLLDDDPASFAHHAAPGASPGAANATE